MRIAIVHDWLITYAGSERVLEQMISCFPYATLFSLMDFLPTNGRSFIAGKAAKTSFIQELPWARSRYRSYLPLMPLAVEQFDLSGYDLVVSSSHAVANGVLVGPDQLHLCMCYSPIRYAWDLQHQYLREAGLDKGLSGWLARWILHKIRLWDSRTANSVDAFMAISHFIARRIEKAYRRDAAVIYPPVDVSGFGFRAQKEDFFLTASRMVPYKKMPMIVQAFSNMPDKRLVVIGDGPEFVKCKALASPNVELLGYQTSEALRDHMQRAKAFVFAAEEDFGIVPLEAQACGTPVIAYGRGAALETMVGVDDVIRIGMKPRSPTALFFSEQKVSAVVEAVRRFEEIQDRIEPEACRQNVLRFAPSRFREEFSSFVENSWSRFRAGERVDGWWLRL